MNDSNERNVPNVEKIISGIRADIEQAEAAVPGDVRKAVAVEDDLAGNLAEANRRSVVGQSRSLILRILHRPIRVILSDINAFNSAVVRTLNRMARILAGEDVADTPELLEKQKRRTDLLESISDRLAKLETTDCDARLKRLEDKVDGLGGKGSA